MGSPKTLIGKQMNDIIRTLLRLKIPGQFLRFTKWIVITIIGLILLLVIWFGGYIAIDKYNESLETMIAFECFWEETSQGEKNQKEWYLVQKKRDKDEPYGLYRGRHLKAIVGQEQIYMQNRLKYYDDKYYFFGINDPPRKDEWGHKINRETLETKFYTQGKWWYTASCKQISESDFYRNVEREVKIKKESVKF